MNRVCSIFSRILQLISRTGFDTAGRKHKAERHARGFSSWGQFVAMLFCQLGGAKSLREICGGLAASDEKLRHLGLPQAPARSTLAYANEHRPWQLYEELFQQLLSQCRGLAVQQSAGRRKFRFKHKLISMDATVIDLCASVFDWARFRRTKGAVKRERSPRRVNAWDDVTELTECPATLLPASIGTFLSPYWRNAVRSGHLSKAGRFPRRGRVDGTRFLASANSFAIWRYCTARRKFRWVFLRAQVPITTPPSTEITAP